MGRVGLPPAPQMIRGWPTLTCMELSYLVDRPELAAGLIPELLDHWREIAPEETAETRAARFRRHLSRDVLPIAWVAHHGAQVMGTASLRAFDLPGHEHLSPWLGGVFVLSRYRRAGVGSALCKVVEEKARVLGFPRFYLFTSDQQRLYGRLGWVHQERVQWRGVDCDLMVKELTVPGTHDSPSR